MADSTTILDQIETAQAQKETTANSLFGAMSGAALFGRHDSACSGRVWAWYGGRWSGSAVANGSSTLTASATVYMVVNRSTGVVSFATTTTDWNDDTTFGRAYLVVVGVSSVTSYEDHRHGASGIFSGGGSGASTDIDALSAASALAAADVYAVSQSGTEKKATHTQLMTAILLLLGDTDGTLAANSATKIAVQSAVKTYVDAKLAGLSWKQAVRAATTANGTLASAFANGSTIDGVTLATGDRILLKNQSTASENGIYVVAASGAPTRATDADSGSELVNASVYVSEGTTNADTQWTCTTNATITVGSTSLVFAQFGTVTLDADLTTIAALTPTNDDVLQFKSSAWANRTIAQLIIDLQGTGLVSGSVGFRHIPQNSQSTAYTTVAADAGKHILHPSADTTARTFTIDSNANVAYPIGTAITFVNQNSAGVATIAIASDTMRLAGVGTTGSRTLAANGMATALKIASTEWIISGTGLT